VKRERPQREERPRLHLPTPRPPERPREELQDVCEPETERGVAEIDFFI